MRRVGPASLLLGLAMAAGASADPLGAQSELETAYAPVPHAGAAEAVAPLVSELCRRSPEFDAMWRANDVAGPHGEAVKQIRHPVLGPLAFEYSVFAVDGRTDLSLVIHNPATPQDARRIAGYQPLPAAPESTA